MLRGRNVQWSSNISNTPKNNDIVMMELLFDGTLLIPDISGVMEGPLHVSRLDVECVKTRFEVLYFKISVCLAPNGLPYLS